jgi:hypothetical protein
MAAHAVAVICCHLLLIAHYAERYSMKKSIKLTTKQLQLTGETLRSLSPLDLPAAAGGASVQTITESPTRCTTIGG